MVQLWRTLCYSCGGHFGTAVESIMEDIDLQLWRTLWYNCGGHCVTVVEDIMVQLWRTLCYSGGGYHILHTHAEFTLFTSSFSSLSTAMDCAANASFTSNRSTSDKLQPALLT